jgi:hypothetical protein
MLCHAGHLISPIRGGRSRPILDTISGAVAAYSLRLLRSAYTGSAVNIRRSSDNAQQDIGFSGGAFDVASFSAFVGGGNGFVAKWYDQSGAGADKLQATAAAQPQLLLNVQNGSPAVNFNETAGQSLATSATIVANPAFVVFAVAQITSHSDNSAAVFPRANALAGSGGMFFFAGSAANDWQAGDLIMAGNGLNSVQVPRAVGATPGGYLDGKAHVLEGALSPTIATVMQDGVTPTLRVATVGTAFVSSTLVIDEISTVGNLFEEIVFATDRTTAQRSIIRVNEGDWYGIGVAA